MDPNGKDSLIRLGYGQLRVIITTQPKRTELEIQTSEHEEFVLAVFLSVIPSSRNDAPKRLHGAS